MTKITTDSILLHAIATHRAAVDHFIEAARDVPDDAWSHRNDGKWSPGQEAAHIALTYSAYTIEVRNGPSVTPETFAPRNPEFQSQILPRILAGNWFPVGGVSPAAAEPPETLSVKRDVLQELMDHARNFEAAVIEAASKDPTRYVRHPYFGALSLTEATIMLREHTGHHGRKIARASEALAPEA